MNIQNERKMKAPALFTCHCSRKTNSKSPSVQPQSVLISFTREPDLFTCWREITSGGTGFSAVLERIRSGGFPWQLTALQLWLCLSNICLEQPLMAGWRPPEAPQKKRRHRDTFSLSANTSAAPAEWEQLPAGVVMGGHPCVNTLNIGRPHFPNILLVK